MSSRSTQLVGGPSRESAHVDGTLNALQVKVVSGGGGGGGDVNIGEVGGNTVGATLPIDGTVSATQSGSWSVTAVQATHDSLNANANLQVGDTDVANGNPVPISDAGGSLTIDGTVSATQSGSWSVTAAQTTHANLNATVRLQDGTGTNLLHVVRDGQTVPTGAVLGIAPVFECGPAEDITISSGDWTRGFVDPDGGLHIHLLGMETGEQRLGKTEDTPHTTGAAGVLTLGVRNDAGSSLVTADGDYSPFSLTSSGALWVKEAGMETIVLSGSTRGRPIQVVGTATGTATTVHTATTTSGSVDRLYLYLSNTSTAAVTVTLEFGTTGSGSEIDIIVSANDTVLAVDGAVLGGGATDVVKSYADTASVVNIFGRVERVSA